MRVDTDVHLPGDLLIESSIDAMIALGPDEVIMAWNQAATSLFDCARDTAIGRKLGDVIPFLKKDEGLRSVLNWALHGKKSFLAATNEFAYRKSVEIHTIPLHQKDAVVGVMLLVHDISDRIAKEVQLRQLNEELQRRLGQLHIANNELAQLTHIAGHNIRGPIREIYTTVEMLLRTEAGVMSNSGRASFRRIQSSLTKMSLLLDDIITLIQINISERPTEVVNMEELISELKKLFSKKLDESAVIFTVDELCDIRAHRSQVLLLLQQIISNVLRLTSPGPPRIHIHCTTFRFDPAKEQQYYLLSITHNCLAFDNIEPGMMLPGTEKTDSRSYTGPAIAMIITARIMDVHSGFLEVEKTGDGLRKIKCFFPIPADATIK